MTDSAGSHVLRRLARAAGVADRYEAAGVAVEPPPSTLRAVLTELGHPCADDEAAARSLQELRRRPWRRPIDPVAVVWAGERAAARVTVSAPDGVAPELTLTLEDGATRPLADPVWAGWADLAPGRRRRGSVGLPDDLPPGYHRVTIDDSRQTATCTVIVAPARCPTPGSATRWGWMVQAYAVRSSRSWGQGEFADLGALAEWSARLGADFVVTNPMHADAPVLPQQPSPYSPTSRRFANPCYLHIPDVEEFAGLDAGQRDRILRLPPALGPDHDRIDRDLIWTTKRDALELMFNRMGPDRRARLASFRTERGASLERFAVFCALAEAHGTPFGKWPPQLRDPRAEEVTRWAADHDDRVAFHAWLQLLCTDQLAAAQRRATSAGMGIGIIGDLAVGVDPDGADVWALPEEFARSMTVGAPPDAFNQRGQDWGQPPLLPDTMLDNGLRTQRELVRAPLSAGGGLRIDHILGLSRLFWIPRGAGPADGTYVRYPVEEQVAVLVLEADRAGAVVIGEDLGTVDERIRRLMRRRGVVSSAVLYFEADDGGRRPASAYPTAAMASVTTHDLPTATAWWDGSALDLRIALGLVDQPVDRAREDLAAQHRTMERLLRDHGCLTGEQPDVRQRLLAMHRFLASTPSLLVAGALWDAAGDPRQPNLPGTVDEYPNWRLPLAEQTDGVLRPLPLERLVQSPSVHQAAAALRR